MGRRTTTIVPAITSLWIAMASPKFVHDTFANGETKSCAACFSAPGGVAAEETSKNVRKIFGCDALTLVGDSQLHERSLALQVNGNCGIGRAVLQRIDDQVRAEQLEVFWFNISYHAMDMPGSQSKIPFASAIVSNRKATSCRQKEMSV